MTNANIDAAIAASKAKKQKAIVISETTILVTEGAIKVTKSGDLALTRGKESDPTTAEMLVFDPAVGAFRPVLMPPGTSWELVEKRQGPGLWHPGMPS